MGADADPRHQLGKIVLQQKLVAPASPNHGHAGMVDALRALSETHGVPSVDLTEQVVPAVALGLIPLEIAHERLAFPFAIDGDALKVAMAAPGDAEAVQEIEFVTGKRVVPHVALDSVLRHVIEHGYAALDRAQAWFVGSAVSAERLAELGISDLAPSPPPPVVLPAPALPPPPSGMAAFPTADASEARAEPSSIRERPSTPEPISRPRPTSTPMDEAFGTSNRTLMAVPAPTTAPRGSVLMAIGDVGARRALETALHAQGISVFEADDGTAAFALAREVSPRLLVVDASLPSLSGLEVARRLVSEENLRGVPVIVLSEHLRGWRVAEDLKEYYGVKHLVETPADPIALARMIQLELDGQPVPPPPPPLSVEAEQRWNDGIEAFEKGELDRAIVELEAGVKLDPSAFEMHYHLGLLHGRREDLFAAICALDRAVSLQPRNFAALKNLAVVCQRAGLRRQARDSWERALTVAPDDATIATIKQHIANSLL